MVEQTTQGPVETIEELERRCDARRNRSHLCEFDLQIAEDAIALCRSLQQQLASIREVLSNGLDRDKDPNDTALQLANVAVNGIFWRDKQLAAKSAEAARMREALQSLLAMTKDILRRDIGMSAKAIDDHSVIHLAEQALTTAEGGKSNHDSTGTR